MVGLFDTNVVSDIFGSGTLTDVVYAVVGFAALMFVPSSAGPHAHRRAHAHALGVQTADGPHAPRYRIPAVRISAKADYALRAAVELAAAGTAAREGRRARHAPRASRRSSSRTSSPTCARPASSAASAAPRAATGSPGRPRRSASPTSSAPSRARWPPCAASAPRTSTTPARAEPLQRVWIAVRAQPARGRRARHARRPRGGQAARATSRARRRPGGLGHAR